jgi:hypothetical protein
MPGARGTDGDPASDTSAAADQVLSAVSRRFRVPVAALTRGVVGGILGTVTMTVYRAPLFEGLPPTAEFWARFVGDREPAAYPVVALLLHFVYGAVAGGVFGVLFDGSWRPGTGHRGSVAMAGGVGYSVLLSLFGSRVLLDRLLAVDLTGREALVFHVGHVVYGLALGTWVGTESTVGRSAD